MLKAYISNLKPERKGRREKIQGKNKHILQKSHILLEEDKG